MPPGWAGYVTGVRQRILGAIGVLLGGAILVTRLFRGRLVEGSGAYARGQLIGLGLATLLLGTGLYYLFKGGSNQTRG